MARELSPNEAERMRVELGLNVAPNEMGALVQTVIYGGTGATTAADARTNFGLGSGDSPQFAAVNIGHATQNTLTGAAGDLSVEGNLLYRAGGTDVPVADGGTGASNASGARTNLGLIIGTDVQAYSANLAAWSALATAAKQDAITPAGAIADASGGATVDTQARTALNALLAALRTQGLLTT